MLRPATATSSWKSPIRTTTDPTTIPTAVPTRARWPIPTRLGQRRARSAALLNAPPCRRRSGLAKNDDEPRPARAPIDLIGTRTSSPPPRELAGGTPRPPPLNSFANARPGPGRSQAGDPTPTAEDSRRVGARAMPRNRCRGARPIPTRLARRSARSAALLDAPPRCRR